MNLAQTKLELAQQLFNTNNEKLLQQIKSLLDNQESAWWDNLHPEVKASAEKAMSQIEQGEHRPHSEVFAKFKQWKKK